jgi:plastocyanin
MRLRNAFVALLLASTTACGQSTPATPTTPSPTPSPSASVAASIVSGSSTLTTTAYAPNPIAVSVGGAVTWTNNDRTTHTSTADGGAWSSGAIAPGATFSMTFPSAGTFAYHCAIHPGMVGTVMVQ